MNKYYPIKQFDHYTLDKQHRFYRTTEDGFVVEKRDDPEDLYWYVKDGFNDLQDLLLNYKN